MQLSLKERAMFGKYLAVLRLPGAARFSAAAGIGRLQMSMMGIGAVLLLSATRDSYGLAGAVGAVYTVSTAVIGPQISRYIDAHGQRRVVPAQLLVHVMAAAGLILVAVSTSLTWPLFVLAAIAGGFQVQLGSLVRARWATLLPRSQQLRTAFAWEALVDEAIFIIGPPLATVLALQLFPSAALAAAVLMMTLGSLLLIRQKATEPRPSGPQPKGSAGRPAILLAGMPGLFAVMILLGGVFGALEVTTIATAKDAGHPGAAGWMLAAYAVGSLLAGAVFGALAPRASLLRQFITSVAALAVVSAPLVFLGSLWLLAVGLFVAGLACAPALISGMALIERIVPAARLTESMAWASSGMNLGLSVSMPLAGWIADHHPPHLAYLVLSGCAVLALLIAIAVARSVGPAQRSEDKELTPAS